MTGSKLSEANITSKMIDCELKASVADASCCSVVPAWTATKEGGATPKKVPIQKGLRSTSIIGDTTLMNQFGKNGVILNTKV